MQMVRRVFSEEYLKRIKAKPLIAGQGLVEFALVIPVVLLLFYGVIEFGRLFYLYSSVQTASRESARFASATENLNNCVGAQETAKRLSFLAGLTNENIAIHRDTGSTSYPKLDCQPVPEVSQCPGVYNPLFDDRVVVQVSFRYKPILPFTGVPGLCFESKTARTILNRVPIVTPGP